MYVPLRLHCKLTTGNPWWEKPVGAFGETTKLLWHLLAFSAKTPSSSQVSHCGLISVESKRLFITASIVFEEQIVHVHGPVGSKLHYIIGVQVLAIVGEVDAILVSLYQGTAVKRNFKWLLLQLIEEFYWLNEVFYFYFIQAASKGYLGKIGHVKVKPVTLKLNVHTFKGPDTPGANLLGK